MTDHPYRILPVDDQKTTNKSEPEVLARHPFSLSLIGTKGSGKSTTLVNLVTRGVFYKDVFDRICIFSPTLYADEKMVAMLKKPVLRVERKDGLPVDPEDRKIRSDDVHTDPETFIPQMRKIRTEYEKLFKDKGKEAIPTTLIIIDDCLGLKLLRDRVLVNFIANCRHLNCSVIVSLQKWNGIPPTIRINATYAILYPIYDLDERKSIYRETGMKFSLQQFNDIMDELFEDTTTRRFLAINNQNPVKYRLIDSFESFIIKN